MELNADFTKRVSCHPAQQNWQSAPVAGVNRIMLDRLGGEIARATSIVRFDPGCDFPPHVHEGGEEYFVLDGVFQDDTGTYPVGSYVRNPPESRHAPYSDPGCTLFVKLWQFSPDDRHGVFIDTNMAAEKVDAARRGVSYIPLHQDKAETVRIEYWAPDSIVQLPQDVGGVEILLLDGSFVESGETFAPRSWLRLPLGRPMSSKAGPEGARVWIKTGHLNYVRGPLGEICRFA